MSTPSVIAARLLIQQAEESQRAVRRAQLIEQLKVIRADIRTYQREFEKLKRQIDKGQTDLDNCRAEIVRHSDALSSTLLQKPAVADHLPLDDDVVDWRSRCETLERGLQILRARRVALPNVELLRIEGVNLAQRIQALQFSANALINTLNGTIAQSPVGGIFSPM